MTKTLSNRVLNRTLLQRQMLLERSSTPPIEAVEYLVGLQALLPLAPYYALWSRLHRFAPMALSEHVACPEPVRLVVIPRTLHTVTAEASRTLCPRTAPKIAEVFGSTAWG